MPETTRTEVETRWCSTPSDASSEAFCGEELVQRCMGKSEFAVKILDLFLARLEADVSELLAATADSDCTRVAQLAHRLKGSSASVAAPRLQRLMGVVEQSAIANNLDEIRDYTSSAGSEAALVRDSIAMWRSAISSNSSARRSPPPLPQDEWRSAF